MSEIKLSNIPTMNVNEVIKNLSKVYCTTINNNMPLKVLPSVMLWGAPGVGKSQGIRQLAKEIEQNTNKKVVVTDVRLLLFNPIDLRGIPTANADKTLAIWLKPQIFQMNDDEGVVNILFLDEISAAPQSVQAAAYQITLDRVVGEHKLPENCIVVAAGNVLMGNLAGSYFTVVTCEELGQSVQSSRLLVLTLKAVENSSNWLLQAGNLYVSYVSSTTVALSEDTEAASQWTIELNQECSSSY